MLMTEWKLEDALVVEREEGREEGLERGREEGLERGREEGREEGLERGREETARNLLKKGWSIEETAEIVDLGIDRLRDLAVHSEE
jgi:predicted transposase/invertase (TIGR01784 family)